MSLFYSIDTDEVKDELDDLRIVIRPAEVSELLDLHAVMLHIDSSNLLVIGNLSFVIVSCGRTGKR